MSGAKVLVQTGGMDSLIPATQVAAFSEEMEAASADYDITIYGGAGHAFTSHDIQGPLKQPGFGYEAEADEQSWQAMNDFFSRALTA